LFFKVDTNLQTPIRSICGRWPTGMDVCWSPGQRRRHPQYTTRPNPCGTIQARHAVEFEFKIIIFLPLYAHFPHTRTYSPIHRRSSRWEHPELTGPHDH
jgi:hypothetical protein